MQLGWPDLLPVTLHLHASRAALTLDRPFPDLLAEEVGRRVFERLLSISASKVPPVRPLAAPPAGAPAVMERYLADVRTDLEQLFASQLQTPDEELVFVAGRGASHDLCTRCAGQGGSTAHQCTFRAADGAADAAALRDRGLCLEPIRELLDYSIGLSMRLYRTPAGAAPQLGLETGHRPRRNALLDTAIFGSVQEDGRTAGGIRRRIVKIMVSLERWEPMDYLSLLAVLFHECFVHGLCGVDVDDIDAKPFHEGWMDCVGVMVLRAELNRPTGLAPPESLGGHHVAYRYRSEFLAQAEVLHQRRYGASVVDFPEVAVYVKGSRALAALRKMLQLNLAGRLSDLDAAVNGIIARMSMTLNEDEDWRNEERARFVTALVANFARTSNELVQRAIGERGAGPWLDELAADPAGGARLFSRRIQASAKFASQFN